jgi:integrase
LNPEPSFVKEASPRNVEETLKQYHDFCIVNRRMQLRTARDYRAIAVRFMNASRGVVCERTVREYLAVFLSRKPKTYNNQLECLRSFVGRFLNRMEIMERFKRVWQPTSYERTLPTKQQLRKGLQALDKDDEKALYLLYATSGVRRSEGLRLTESDIDFSLRCVKPKHDTRTKKGGVSFYNEECAVYLERLKREDSRIFHIGKKRFKRMWNRASGYAGFRITPQVLRVWHSTELGELGLPDRYVDVFQGRAPKTMIGRFYTGKELLRLKRIYEKANLRVLA